jgi:hypothetical protein
LPDAYNYPPTLNGHRIPEAIMVYAPSIENLDYLMLREVWRMAWERFYAL